MVRLLYAFLALLTFATGALGQSWPLRPMTLVVAFPAGGSDDILARMLAPRLAEFLGQPINVENTGGSGGVAGATRVARAVPDGYEFMLGTTTTHAISQALHRKPPYNAAADFTPVALIAEQPFMVVARKGLPGHRLDDLVAYVKANPRHAYYASDGEGSGTHLVCSLFNSAAGMQGAVHIAYTGAAAAMRDVAAGRVDYFCSGLTIAIAPASRQDVRAVAVLSRHRAHVLPEVASAHEQGLADFSAWTWFALFLPKDAPPAVSARLHEATASAVGMPFMQARLKQIGVEVVSPERRSPEYLQKFVESEIAKWASAIKAAHFKLE